MRACPYHVSAHVGTGAWLGGTVTWVRVQEGEGEPTGRGQGLHGPPAGRSGCRHREPRHRHVDSSRGSVTTDTLSTAPPPQTDGRTDSQKGHAGITLRHNHESTHPKSDQGLVLFRPDRVLDTQAGLPPCARQSQTHARPPALDGSPLPYLRPPAASGDSHCISTGNSLLPLP